MCLRVWYYFRFIGICPNCKSLLKKGGYPKQDGFLTSQRFDCIKCKWSGYK